MIRATPGVSGTLTLDFEAARVLVAFEAEEGDAEGGPEEDLLTAGP
jgi:hypothetical protein